MMKMNHVKEKPSSTDVRVAILSMRHIIEDNNFADMTDRNEREDLQVVFDTFTTTLMEAAGYELPARKEEKKNDE